MVKHIFSLWFGLCVLLGACMPQEVRRETITSEEKISTSTTSEEKTPAELATSTPTRTPTEINLSPIFVYLEGEALLAQIGSNAPEHIIDLPELGLIKDAVLVGETLHLLREQGIQKIYLSEGKSDIVSRFDMPILEGGLIFAADHHRMLYYGSESGQETLIGYFGLDENTVHSAFSLPQNLQILGMTEDGLGWYGLPLGQDPEFGKVLLIDLEQGDIARELPVQGIMFAALAPDARLLATFARRPDPSGQLESVIYLYDLPSLPLTPPRMFTLPNAPSYVGFGGLHWSPDSQWLYFMLVENIYEAPATTSYGLWRLDVQTGETDQVATISDAAFHSESVSPNGECFILKHEVEDEIALVQLQTGEVQSFSSPVDAIFAGWR